MPRGPKRANAVPSRGARDYLDLFLRSRLGVAAPWRAGPVKRRGRLAVSIGTLRMIGTHGAAHDLLRAMIRTNVGCNY